MSNPTFGALCQVLKDLGFQAKAAPQPPAVFEHARSGTLVFLRAHTADEPVDQANLLGIRRLLDERGVVARERFDELLKERSLAG
jgi:hypothetical protein